MSVTTNETKFTPGPWMAASAPSSVVGWPVVGGMGRSIANVTWLTKEAASVLGGSDADYDAFNKQCRANAHLIAAAPELLTALIAVMEGVDGARSDGDLDCSTEAGGYLLGDVMNDAVDAARAALAKARGEAA